MSVVFMGMQTEFLSRGYPYCTATLYVYCDKCGSFDISTYWGPNRWVVLASPCILVAAVVHEMLTSERVYLWWVFLGLAGILLACWLLWGDPIHRCRKCGHIATTTYNTWKYPPDVSIVDVPVDQVKKLYRGYWPDMYDMEEALKPPREVALDTGKDKIPQNAPDGTESPSGPSAC